MSLKVAVLASGRGSNLGALLAAIEAGHVDARVGLVLTDRSGAACLDIARSGGVPALVELPRETGEDAASYDDRLIEVLQAESPDLIVLAGFMRILGSAFCAAFAGRIINIHPALLPSFKGPHGVRDTLAAGARVAGCTTHFVTAQLDGGPIILQAAIPVFLGEGLPSLAARVLALEHQILPRTVQLIAEGRVHDQSDGTVAVDSGPSWFDAGVVALPGALYPDGF